MAVTRIVLVRLRDEDRSPALRERIAEEARRVFPRIPGVQSITAGLPADTDEWDVLLVVGFGTLEAVEAYRTHELHVGFVEEWLKPHLDRLEAHNFRV